MATRLAGTDGVSLEQEKIRLALEELGHEVFHCAGELSGNVPGQLIPEMHFNSEVVEDFTKRAFAGNDHDPELEAPIREYAASIAKKLELFLVGFQIDHVIVQNAFATPMHLPLGIAIHDAVKKLGLPTLAHNHDYHWERERFSTCCVPDLLKTYFPPGLPQIQHASISSIARDQLLDRRGLGSLVLPNVANFEVEPPGIDSYNADFRSSIGVSEEDLLFLQPTRVVPRKGIEMAIEFVASLKNPRIKLVLTHEAGDEGMDYLHYLERLAEEMGVTLLYVADRIGTTRGTAPDGSKIYSLWDSYPHADFVTYPSLVEGFGNALVETMYFRKPALVNRYEVYKSDLAPTGLRFVEIDGQITDESIEETQALLRDPQRREADGQHNFEIGLRYFAYSRLAELLEPVFGRV